MSTRGGRAPSATEKRLKAKLLSQATAEADAIVQNYDPNANYGKDYLFALAKETLNLDVTKSMKKADIREVIEDYLDSLKGTTAKRHAKERVAQTLEGLIDQGETTVETNALVPSPLPGSISQHRLELAVGSKRFAFQWATQPNRSREFPVMYEMLLPQQKRNEELCDSADDALQTITKQLAKYIFPKSESADEVRVLTLDHQPVADWLSSFETFDKTLQSMSREAITKSLAFVNAVADFGSKEWTNAVRTTYTKIITCVIHSTLDQIDPTVAEYCIIREYVKPVMK